MDIKIIKNKMREYEIKAINEKYENFDEQKLHNYQRLVSAGLMKNDSKFDSGTSLKGMLVTENSTQSPKMELTLLGKQFAKIITTT